MIKKFLFPHCLWANIRSADSHWVVLTKFPWKFINFISRLNYFSMHTQSSTFYVSWGQVLFAVGLGGKIKVDARNLGYVPKGKKGASTGSHQKNQLQFALFVYQMSRHRTRFPAILWMHIARLNSCVMVHWGNSKNSRIKSQAVVIPINAFVNKEAVYL